MRRRPRAPVFILPPYAQAVTPAAGRVLDAWIADKVFGLPVKWAEHPYDLQAIGVHPFLKGHARGCEYDWASVDPYSTDDAAAVSVIRRMAALGWRWCVHDSDSYEADAEQADAEPFYCYFQKATPDGGVAEPEAAGETFALSVARAALGAFCEVEKTNG